MSRTLFNVTMIIIKNRSSFLFDSELTLISKQYVDHYLVDSLELLKRMVLDHNVHLCFGFVGYKIIQNLGCTGTMELSLRICSVIIGNSRINLRASLL